MIRRRAGRARSERFEITGVVQGVGFRPFVYRLATELGLEGEVGNDPTGVFVDVTGPAAALDEFARRVASEAPPLAIVRSLRRRSTAPRNNHGFRIVGSTRTEAGTRTAVPPDTAVCAECLREMFDPTNRRHLHPFVTCTNCGPRFTIIRDLPYDRPATTMADFPMCAACQEEYLDPGDRRYHAQPIACHDCGPRLVFRPGNGDPPSERHDAVVRATEALRAGLTVAVKGIGGFHLACDATDTDAVTRLRDRKHRPDKPFAVLVRDLAAAAEVAFVSDDEAAELTSPACPIVLLRARPDSPLSPLVAPGNPLVGVMLPHTPVQHLLVRGGPSRLVMTSGNLSGEPIAYRDDDLVRLAPLCDAVLTHDREIHQPCDDSVVRVLPGALLPIRRSRGYAPVPIAFPHAVRPVLAVGGELKNTFCLAGGGQAWVSQHIGDMENLETLETFADSVERFTTLYRVDPDRVVADAHPGYATTRWARARAAGRVVEVQHHHAHVAAVMAEHGLDPRRQVVGVAFDGTGYGTDGAIWGGEVLFADAAAAHRVWHLAYVPLPGGDAAIRNPYRVALTHLRSAGVDWDDDLAPVRQLDQVERRLLDRQLTTGFACTPTSSMGRLFDAVASLLDLRHRVSYEAQAAIELEIAAERAGPADHGLRFGIADDLADPAPVVRGLVALRRAGVPTGELAAAFHTAVAELVGELATAGCGALRSDRVVLSGGVFQNALLTAMCTDRIRRAGLEPLTHRVVPPNDGGLALGQAFIGAHRPLQEDD